MFARKFYRGRRDLSIPSPPSLHPFRETRSFLNQARTICLFKFSTRIRNFCSPFPTSRPPVSFSLPASRDPSAKFTNQYFTVRVVGELGGRLGCSILEMQRDCVPSRDVTARVREANVPFKIHVTSRYTASAVLRGIGRNRIIRTSREL